MIYEYKCKCGNQWSETRKMEDRNEPSQCNCGKMGRRVLSALPSYYNRTHPDIKQDIHELVAGVPGNIDQY